MSPEQGISTRLRLRLVLVAAVLVIAGAVWGVSETQRGAADRAFREAGTGQMMLTAMLDQETGARGFIINRGEEFLEPYREGARDFESAVVAAQRLADSDDSRERIDAQAAAAENWRRLADEEITRLRGAPRSRQPQFSDARKRYFDEFRAANAGYQGRLRDERQSELRRAGLVSVGVILALGALFFGFGYVFIERQAARERRRREHEHSYRESQAEFTETMQIMRDEPEAHELVQRHLERTIPGSSVVVLNRNHSDNRLTATTDVPDGSALTDKLVDAGPESCLAVRLARPYEQGLGAHPLLSCQLCGQSSDQVTCVPSLVSGEVIGSVLVQHTAPLGEQERDRVTESVNQAAPVLANLRNLAIAEARAATDALTGLPNKRSCDDTLKRMVAHAGRVVQPLTAVLLDLDHFKQVNDLFGHGAGDDVLAATGEVLRSCMRESDFAGRFGGEEFLLLLPDTGHDGAMVIAEKLRGALERIDVPAVESAITGSFGLATLPNDALDGDTVVRMADRALYAAKRSGRNRVEVAEPSSAAVEEA